MPLHLNLDILHKGVYKSDKTFTVKIKLLDNTIINVKLLQKAKGVECLDKIALSLGLEEVNTISEFVFLLSTYQAELIQMLVGKRAKQLSQWKDLANGFSLKTTAMGYD